MQGGNLGFFMGGFADQGRCPQNGQLVFWFLKVCGRMKLWIPGLSLGPGSFTVTIAGDRNGSLDFRFLILNLVF